MIYTELDLIPGGKSEWQRMQERDQYVRENNGCLECGCVPADQNREHYEWCPKVKREAAEQKQEAA